MTVTLDNAIGRISPADSACREMARVRIAALNMPPWAFTMHLLEAGVRILTCMATFEEADSHGGTRSVGSDDLSTR